MGLFFKYFKNLALIMLISKSLANVTISVGDVSVSGYTEDIVVPVTLSNPENIVGGFQFDVIVLPTLIELSGASAVDADNFSADYNVFDDGSGRIVFYSGNGSSIAQGGDDVVMNLHYDGSEILSANLDLDLFDLTVSDENGNIIRNQDGSAQINRDFGYETQTLVDGNGYPILDADGNEQVQLAVQNFYLDRDYDAFGGNILATASLELLFPLPFVPNSNQVRSAFFIDAGNVFSSYCTNSQASLKNC